MRLPLSASVAPSTLGIGALLLAALITALFFNGVHLTFYAASGGLLVIAMAVGAYRAAGERQPIPLNPLNLALTLYWIWLGVNTVLSPAPGVSGISFWWLGALPLAFWSLTLARGNEGDVWRLLFQAIVAVGAALALYALLQTNLLLETPSATFINKNNLAAFLNLIALPLLAHTLLLRRAGPHQRTWPASAALFTMLLMALLIGSRGALLGLLGGLAILLLANYRLLDRRDYVYLALLIGGAFLAADLLSQGYISERSLSLASPNSAGASRWLIWERAWAMLQDVPWYGIGIGVFWLAFPPYRDPSDQSGGYYVHNDYLQLWIEAGWPGLLLFLLFCAALGWRFIGFLLRGPASSARLEASGLFAGMAAIGAHSLFTFNLYLMPTLLVGGAMLARFHQLTDAEASKGVRFGGRLKPRFVQALVVLGTLFPLMHFGSHFGTEVLRQKAGAQLQEGELEAAHRSLLRAQRLSPALDVAWYSHAEVLRDILEGIDHRDEGRRRTLFEIALANLDHAQRVNPYRAETHHLRGVLIGQERALVGAGWQDEAIAAFKHALRLDPRFVPARLAWADLVLKNGAPAEALAILNEGLTHWYGRSTTTATYLWRTAALHAHFQDWEAVETLARRYQAVLGLPAPFGLERLQKSEPQQPTAKDKPPTRDTVRTPTVKEGGR